MPALLSRLARRDVALALPVVSSFLVTPVMADESCNSESVLWSSDRATIEVGNGSAVVCSLEELATLVPTDLLQILEPGLFFLSSDLYIRDGSTVTIQGPEAGGTVAELRILSSNAPQAAHPFFQITADYGTLIIDSTRISSWDDMTGGPDEIWSNGRSFLSAKSKLDSSDPANPVPRESTMDVYNSDIGYLGYNAAESQGLAWKVNGKTATDVSVFDTVGVYGTIRNNVIHHLYYGSYSYGGQAMEWSNNVFRNNVKYGLDPHDDSDYLVIVDNIAHDNGANGIICSIRCDHLTITGNITYNNDGHGIMLHSKITDSLVADNIVYNNRVAGIALFDADNTVVRNNHIYNNQIGIRLSAGADNNLIENNVIENNAQGYVTYLSKADYVDGDGRPRGNTLTDNLFSGNAENAILLKQGEDHLFSDNIFVDNGPITLRDSHDAVFFNTSLAGDNATVVSESSTSQFERISPFFLQTTGDSVTEFVSAEGQIYDLSRGRDISTFDDSASALAVDPAMVAGYTTVNPRPLFLQSNADAVQAYIRGWKLEGDYAKELWMRAYTAGVEVTVRIGDLLPDTAYQVLDINRGTPISSVSSDSNGEIVFTAPLASRVIEKLRVQPL